VFLGLICRQFQESTIYILFCCAHVEQVKEYISKSHWGQSRASFSITTIESNFSISAGNALRFIEGKNVVCA
jgi:translation initiation factor eIF-2B subunit epsilon